MYVLSLLSVKKGIYTILVKGGMSNTQVILKYEKYSENLVQ